MVRVIVYSIELLVLYVLQSTSFLPAFDGARPLLLVCAAMMIALFEGDVTGMVFGVAAGLLIDMGGDEVLGFHALLLGVCGYVLGSMTMELFRTNLLVAMLAALPVCALVCGLEWVFCYWLQGYNGAVYVLQTHYLPKAVYTYVLVPIAYAMNRFFALRLSEEGE